MNPETSVIVADKPSLPVFAIAPAALQLRDDALAGAALIGKVENAAQNESAVVALRALKQIRTSFEGARKKLKEPILEAGRQLDRAVNAELIEIEKEEGRLQNLAAQFQQAEARRVREEQELQRKELERIEREKQAELDRIAREQAAIERTAREQAEAATREAQRIEQERLASERAAIAQQKAAERAAAEATNAEQRKAAEEAQRAANAARQEAERAAAEANRENEAKRIEAERIQRQATELAAAQAQNAAERAANLTAAEAKPITATRSFGQMVKEDWEVSVTNPWELAKFHPDCVKIEPLLLPIKVLLNQGITVKGVRAERTTKVTARSGKAPLTIEA